MNVTSKTQGFTALSYAASMAAETVGVRLFDLRESGKRGIAFRLKTGEHAEPRIDWRGKRVLSPRYQRLSQHIDRSTARGTEGLEFQRVVPGAVCWHGHRDFLREFYRLVPDAKVRTAMATYLSQDHFEASHHGTYYRGGDRMGMHISPYGDACTCEE